MKNIVYCEDKAEHIEMFRRDFCDEDSEIMGYHFTACQSSDELIELIDGGLKPEIVLMDLELEDGKNGLDIAEALYSISSDTQIIYVTAYTDRFIQDVFLHRANVCGFLQKPVRLEYLRKMVIKTERCAADKHRITFSSREGVFSLPESKIAYLESYKRHLIFHTAERDYNIYGSLSEYLPQLSSGFMLCHQSFAVNLIHVKGMRKSELVMNDGRIIPVSRSQLKKVRDILLAGAFAAAEGMEP